MDVDHDPAFYGDAVLPSEGEEEADDLPQATLKLLGDFPEPLTEPQRRAVQHHVSQQVREFEMVRRQVGVVELGYLALLRLVKRLRRERAKLQASLQEKETETPASKAPAPSPATTTTTAASAVPDAAATTTTRAAATSATKESAAAPKRRPGGLLLRSAVFSSLQRTLQTAKSEQHDAKAEQLARQRERIAKESRLHLLSQDLAAQEALLEPLQRTYDRAMALGHEAAERAIPLLTLLEDMWRLEALYPARFSLHAAGSLEPFMVGAGGAAGGADVGEAEGDDDGANEEAEKIKSVEASTAAAATAAAGTSAAAVTNPVAFAIPFTPAQYSSEVEDVIRAQVEDIIDEYLAYRSRMDPVLYQLEQALQVAKAQQVDRLMDIIGIRGAEVMPLGTTTATATATAAGAGGYASNALTGTAGLAGKAAAGVLHISSSDEDDDNVEETGGVGAEAADKDRQDREHIRTALTALDDFEDA